MFELSFKGTHDEWNALFAGMLAHVRTPKPEPVAVATPAPKLDAVQSRIAPELRRINLPARGDSGLGQKTSAMWAERRQKLWGGDSGKMFRAKQKANEFKARFVTFMGSDVGALSTKERAEFNDWCKANDIDVAKTTTKYKWAWVYTPFIKDEQGNVLYADGPRGKDSPLRGAPARVEHRPHVDKLDDVDLVPRFAEPNWGI